MDNVSSGPAWMATWKGEKAAAAHQKRQLDAQPAAAAAGAAAASQAVPPSSTDAAAATSGAAEAATEASLGQAAAPMRRARVRASPLGGPGDGIGPVPSSSVFSSGLPSSSVASSSVTGVELASGVTEGILEAKPALRKIRASAGRTDGAKEASKGIPVAKKRSRPGKKSDAAAKFRLEFDGGSRGNPGTGGFGAALRAQDSGAMVGLPGVTRCPPPLSPPQSSLTFRAPHLG